ncbi:TrmH family RNA methyltransferase [Abyssisolibacter fermentans]|uniref:TrmH family RNA methyltransferase n=1 Tax=Abyssisolibacter fermentans TaxID=1766203 RepID=UPI00082F3A7B|nr:TrmH family RNA methyltransferase [Abyssisolibacter fermentans]
MELNIEQLYNEFSNLKFAGIKEPAIRIINDIIKNKKIEDEDLFVIEGLWAYEKIIKSNLRIRCFAFCPDFIKNDTMLKIARFCIHAADDTYLISSKLCRRISSRDDEGFFLLCSTPQYKLSDIKLKEDNLLVILDGLENPGNIGTIIRTVDGAGGDGVIICNSEGRKLSQKLIKSSMGSSFILPVIKKDIKTTVMWLKNNGFRIIVTDLKANERYYNTDYEGRIAIVVGNERHGISYIWNEHDCHRVIIPMYGGADSLNAGVAASIVVYEASCKQRELKQIGF